MIDTSIDKCLPVEIIECSYDLTGRGLDYPYNNDLVGYIFSIKAITNMDIVFFRSFFKADSVMARCCKHQFHLLLFLGIIWYQIL